MNAKLGWEDRSDDLFSAREEEYELDEFGEEDLEEYEEEYGEYEEEEFADDELDDFDYYEDEYEEEFAPRRRRREWE